MEYVKSNKGGFKLLYDNYRCMWSRRFFKNHRPTRGYTGNHCTISKLCTWETMKSFKKWNTKILLWGISAPGGSLSWNRNLFQQIFPSLLTRSRKLSLGAHLRLKSNSEIWMWKRGGSFRSPSQNKVHSQFPYDRWRSLRSLRSWHSLRIDFHKIAGIIEIAGHAWSLRFLRSLQSLCFDFRMIAGIVAIAALVCFPLNRWDRWRSFTISEIDSDSIPAIFGSHWDRWW